MEFWRKLQPVLRQDLALRHSLPAHFDATASHFRNDLGSEQPGGERCPRCDCGPGVTAHLGMLGGAVDMRCQQQRLVQSQQQRRGAGLRKQQHARRQHLLGRPEEASNRRRASGAAEEI